jgi:hypothetical protein
MVQILQGKPVTGIYSYLSESEGPIALTTDSLNTHTGVLQVLKQWNIKATQRIVTRGMNLTQNDVQVDSYEATLAHFLYRYTLFFVDRAVQFPALAITLNQIVTIFATSHMLPYIGSILSLGVVSSPDAVFTVKQALFSSLKEIRKIAVPLVDAFDYNDDELLSAIGSYDGDSYNRLFNAFKNARYNREKDAVYGHLKYIQPLAKL